MIRYKQKDFLIYWINERESVRKKKEANAPWPWSKDEIFQNFKFCNVRRRDDRVSRWIDKHIISLYSEDNLREFLMFSALCRYINWPPTIKAIMQKGLHHPLQMDAICELMDEQVKMGGKTWTGAYMVRAPNKHPINGVERPLTKAEYVTKVVVEAGLGEAMDEVLAALATRTRQAVHTVLDAQYGWGSFMAGQVLDDWTWTPVLADPIDQFTWAPRGPGSVRGFNRLLGRHPTYIVGEEEWCGQLREWRVHVIDKLGSEYENVTLHDMQNCCCEIDKYLRVLRNEGQMRSRYTPETRF